jgi:hypothetical protein
MTTFCWAVNSVPEWIAVPEFLLTFESCDIHYSNFNYFVDFDDNTWSFYHKGHI